MYTPEQRGVLSLTPGITDPASIAYKGEGALLAAAPSPEDLYVNVIMPEKIRLNLEYARTATVLTDLRLIVKTVFCLFRP
jgi:lipopolysaccharide/colanic/teichoic acid biosynthesis glycosyltransferase